MLGKHDNGFWAGLNMMAVNLLIRLMNAKMFLGKNRKALNFRWANSVLDAFSFVGEFAEGQFTKVYGRVSVRYKFHPQQQHENAIRRFDATDGLAADMAQRGNAAFYQSVCGPSTGSKSRCPVDLTRLKDISTIKASAEYLYNEILRYKAKEAAKGAAKEAAQIARDTYVRGFSRAVKATDDGDWERFREELRKTQHSPAAPEDQAENHVTLIAVSYKGKEMKITHRMRMVEDDGKPVKGSEMNLQEEKRMTADFLDDFRWGQLVRSCKAIARFDGTSHVRLWIDRLCKWGLDKEEKDRIDKLVKWEDFGLLSYAVCQVVRLYSINEPEYGTDFWRKLETVLGIAGKGMVLDDYMLRKYDFTIFYGPTLYQRMGDGLCLIGGGGIYVRSTTLALATALLTDGISVSEANEDPRTKAAAGRWKAWALRTITEGAYSKEHTSMMMQDDEPLRIGYEQFLILAFWESMVSRSSALTGGSYMDMSLMKSMSWRKSACWNGVVEWVGMMGGSCEIVERDVIMQFLKEQTIIGTYVSTTGHVASILTLTSSDMKDKRTIVVDLARFSTARRGHVTAVAEATGLWKRKLLPFYLRHIPNPDNDQKVEFDDGAVKFIYEPMKVGLAFVKWIWGFLVTTLLVILIITAASTRDVGARLFLVLLAIVDAVFFIMWLRGLHIPWPWTDRYDVGEAVFDNLLLHGLYAAGIKKDFRRLQAVPYDEIRWTGISEQCHTNALQKLSYA